MLTQALSQSPKSSVKPKVVLLCGLLDLMGAMLCEEERRKKRGQELSVRLGCFAFDHTACPPSLLYFANYCTVAGLRRLVFIKQHKIIDFI